MLQAAARRFREHGYAATTLRDIAREAGMLPGSLHYRYPTKEDILSSLMERAIDRLISGVLSASAVGTGPLERLRLAIVEHVRILLSTEDSVYVLLYDWRSLSPAAGRVVAKHRRRYEQFADELLAQAAADAELQPGVDLYLLRQFGFGAANWVAQWFEPGGPYTPEQIANAFFRYLTMGTLQPLRGG
ncbi:TetR/AcrR family transcriptional regulator [soil metagenome]